MVPEMSHGNASQDRTQEGGKSVTANEDDQTPTDFPKAIVDHES